MSDQGRSLLVTLVLLLSPIRAVQAQVTPAPILGKSADNAASGSAAEWDFGATDVTIKATKKELWVLDSFSPDAPFINVFDLADLSANPSRVFLNLPPEFTGAPVMGLAEITHGDLAGKNLILIDPTFGTQNAPQPMLAVFEDDGNLIAGGQFAAVAGADPSARLSSLDVNPVRDEIAVYDISSHGVYLLDFSFEVIDTRIPLLGFRNRFVRPWFLGNDLQGSGTGIAYQGPDRLLSSAAFLNGFETHLVLEYDLTRDGLFTGRAMDLSIAGSTGFSPDVAFMGLDAGNTGNQDMVFAINFGDDTVYGFGMLLEPTGPPVSALACLILDSGQYQLNWFLDAFQVDAIHVIENGVDVAVLAPTATTYTSPLPLLGKAFVEVATEKDGLTSIIRPVCQMENTDVPNLPTVGVVARQVLTLGDLFGVAVTKTPATPADFRGYLLGANSNTVAVFNENLEIIETFQPNPAVTTQGTNLAGIGLALTTVDGEDLLAILDPDGPTDNNNTPSASLYHRTGPEAGNLFRQVSPIGITGLSPRPFLLDWDSDPDGNFVAGGLLINTGEYVVVHIEFDRAQNTMTANDMATIPQRELTALRGDPLVGIGVSVLPSGNILVAGSDTFSRTYTEALLTTGFNADPLKSVKPVGYAQGLIVSNQFFGFGPGIGPIFLYGMATAYFAPQNPDEAGVGVTYLPTGDLFLITNPSVRVALTTQGQLLIHSENRCSHPDLVAEQLIDTIIQVPAGQKSTSALVSPEFAGKVKTTDYFCYLINQSPSTAVKLEMEVSLGGTVVPEASLPLGIAAGRYYRGALLDRTERDLQIAITNKGPSTARIRIIAGAMGINTGTVAPRFRRGDCDADGALLITDPIVALNYMFLGGEEPICLDACDVDDGGSLEITDAINVLSFMFQGGPPPAPPGPTSCGEDDKADDTLKPCTYSPALCQ